MEGVSRSFLTLFAPSLGGGVVVSASLAVPELHPLRRASCHLVVDTDEEGGELREILLEKWVSETVGSPWQPETPPTRFQKPPHQKAAQTGS